MADWRPPITKDPVFNEAMRIVFDNLYQLRDQTVLSPSAGNNNNGNSNTTVTIISGGGGGGGGNNSTVSAPVIVGTHADRNAVYPASSQPIGALYYETDRTLWYVVVGPSPHWIYGAGIFYAVQASIPTDVGLYDTGMLVSVVDYLHTMVWDGSGSAWSFAPGDSGSGYIQTFTDKGPTGNALFGWKLCDGSNANYLKSDATLGSITLPDLVTTPIFPKFGNNYTGNAVAPIAPTVTMNSYTPTGSISAPTFTGNSNTTSSNSAGTPTGNISTPTFTGNNITFATTPVNVGVTNNVLFTPSVITPSGVVSTPTFTGDALAGHTHTLTPTGSVSAPTFTGNAATLTGTVSNNGEPRKIVLLPYFRI